MRKLLNLFFTISFAFLFLSGSRNPASLDIVYLSYHADPSSSMSLYWHTSLEDLSSKISFKKKGESDWRDVEGGFVSADPYKVLIHHCELNGLEPSTEYEFRIGPKAESHLFSTLPADLQEDPLRFVVAGDAYRSYAAFHALNKQIVCASPSFIVIGGDIAYTKGGADSIRDNIWEIKKWHSFFSEWQQVMKTSSGHMIPIVPVVGNHDVPSKMVDPKENFVLLYKLFPFFQSTISYGALDVGSYLSFFVLDTSHTYPIAGAQSEWLKKALEERRSVPFKLAAYHVSAYPSVYKYSSKTSTKVRESWCPLFEEEGLMFAFEHHNHAYKRTFPIKNQSIDPKGVIYMGDGSWGVSPRRPYKAWYLQSRKKENCFNIVSLSKEGCEVTVVSNRGVVIDKAHRPLAAPL